MCQRPVKDQPLQLLSGHATVPEKVGVDVTKTVCVPNGVLVTVGERVMLDVKVLVNVFVGVDVIVGVEEGKLVTAGVKVFTKQPKVPAWFWFPLPFPIPPRA